LSNIKKDINSTEKLLNVIRGKDEESFGDFGKEDVSLSAKKQIKKVNPISSKRFFGKENYSVGVDIGRDFICLVKTALSSDNIPVLADKKIIKHNSQLSMYSPEFKTLLKSSIHDFCGTVNDCNIWTKISTSEVSVYFFNIPRVPKKQLDKVILGTAKKEGFVDESKHIFDFELRGEVIEQGNPKYSVMFYTAFKTEVEKIKSFFSDMGITLAGITIVPFAIQNIFRSKWMPLSDEIFSILFIGNSYSRIDVYNKENLIMTRGIKTGSGSSMVEAIISAVLEKTGNVRLDYDEAKKILLSIGSESEKLKDADSRKNFTKEEILKMISPVWERLARQVDLTLKTSSIVNQKVEKIYILSSINVDKSILDYLSNQLGSKTELFDPFGQENLSASGESLSFSDRILIAPALGFSLSDNKLTPNIIFTFQEKKNEISSERINKYIFVSFLMALIICLVTLIYQGSRLSVLKKDKNNLDKELSLFVPHLSAEKMLKEVNEVKMRESVAHKYAQKYINIAAIGEVCDLTPQNVRLMSCRITQGNAALKTDAGKTPEEATDDVTIEGIISGDKYMLESDLTKYVLKLENSPIFSKVSVKKKDLVKFKKNEVIHFVLGAKIG
jgi:hypothetical protein